MTIKDRYNIVYSLAKHQAGYKHDTRSETSLDALLYCLTRYFVDIQKKFIVVDIMTAIAGKIEPYETVEYI